MTPTHWGAPDTPAPEPERLVGAERWCHLEGRTSSGRRITFRAGEGERLQVLQDGRWRPATDAEAILLGSSEEGLSWARQHLDAGELFMVVPYTPRDPEAAPWRFPEGALEAVAAFWRRSCSAALGNGGRPPLGWPPAAAALGDTGEAE